MAGHCIRHPKLLASDLVLWEPMHGRAQQGRPRQSYLSMLLKEVVTNSKEELRTLMRDRNIYGWGYLALRQVPALILLLATWLIKNQ